MGGSGRRGGLGLAVRRWSQRVQRLWPAAPIVLGAVGFGFGWYGYRSVYPDASSIDLAYAAVQLLVLNGPTNLDSGGGLPVSLSIARVVAAGAPGATLILLAIRFVSRRADTISGRWMRHHLVVLGAGPAARQLAIARSASGGEGQRVVLVGALHGEAVADLRSHGVAVVDEADGTLLQQLARGAEEVVLMEATDGQTLRRLHAVRSAVRANHTSKKPSGLAPAIRVILESPELARTQRGQAGAEAGHTVSIVSMAEVVARRVTGSEWFPPATGGRADHVVVVGNGNHATEIALAAFHRRYVPGRAMRIDLFAAPGHTWHTEVLTQVPPALVDDGTGANPSAVFHCHVGQWLRAEQIAEAIAQLCAGDADQHQIFVAGLPDERTFPIGQHLARLCPGATVVSVLHDEDFSEAGGARGGAAGTDGGSWRVVHAGLLAEADVLRLAMVEQIAAHLLQQFHQLHALPGSLASSPCMRGFHALSAGQQRAWAEGLATELVSALARLGVHVAPGFVTASDPLGGGALVGARAVLAAHCQPLAPAAEGALPLPGSVLRVASILPQLVARAGAHLRDDEGRASGFAALDVDRLAEQIHADYLRSMTAAGDCAAAAHVGREWAQLTEEEREKNRRPARDIETRVLNAGLRAVPLSTPGAQPLAFNEATVERLAEDEHEAWMLHQLLNGYRAGSRRDEHTRIHHLMVAYGDLPAAEQDKDRAIVRNTPQLLACIGWGVVPVNDPKPAP